MPDDAIAIAQWLLTNAGWNPERQIDPMPLLAWYQTHGYTLWPEADLFVRSFGRLQLDTSVYSEQHLPPEAVPTREPITPMRFRWWRHGRAFAIHLHPESIPDLPTAMQVWSTSRVVQTRDRALPLGTCRTPLSPYQRPLFLHRQYGLLLECPGYRKMQPFPLFQSYGTSMLELLTIIVRQCVIYEWTKDTWPYS